MTPADLASDLRILGRRLQRSLPRNDEPEHFLADKLEIAKRLYGLADKFASAAGDPRRSGDEEAAT